MKVKIRENRSKRAWMRRGLNCQDLLNIPSDIANKRMVIV